MHDGLHRRHDVHCQPATRGGRQLRGDVNGDVHVERQEAALKALLAEARELASHEVGDVWGGESQRLGGPALCPGALPNEL